MKCKYCDIEGLHWSESYQKGDRPLEPDTNIPHTWERCQNRKNPYSKKEQFKKSRAPYPDRNGWFEVECKLCGCKMKQSKKWFKEPKPLCSECNQKDLSKLEDYGISL